MVSVVSMARVVRVVMTPTKHWTWTQLGCHSHVTVIVTFSQLNSSAVLFTDGTRDRLSLSKSVVSSAVLNYYYY